MCTRRFLFRCCAFPLQRVKRDLKRAISVHDGKAALLPMSRSEVADLEANLEHSLAHKKQLEAKLTETRLEVRCKGTRGVQYTHGPCARGGRRGTGVLGRWGCGVSVVYGCFGMAWVVQRCMQWPWVSCRADQLAVPRSLGMCAHETVIAFGCDYVCMVPRWTPSSTASCVRRGWRNA
jgi:hypothetical protein